MPKLFARQYNAEISTLLGEKADVIHSSFTTAISSPCQAAPRGLLKKSTGY